MPLKQVQPAVAYAAAHLDQDLSLEALAAKAGLSAFHLHRVFSTAAGETPKQFALRLRLGRASAMLLTSDDSVLNVALDCGFQSHEAFSRAFRRRFGMTPSAYRVRGFAAGGGKEHAALVNKIGPCVGLYHSSENGRSQKIDMPYSITRKVLSPQPVLVVQRRIPRSAIAATIAEVLPLIFQYAQQKGIAFAGLPFTRYVEVGAGLITIEPGMRIANPTAGMQGEGDVRSETLPGGPVAMTTHTGPYDKLSDAYAAIEQWIASEGFTPGGAPWECYVTDPGEVPDPKDWKTDIFWPLVQE